MFGHECVMITGGCGAMGSVLVNYLKDKYPTTRFINLDLLTYCGHAENIKAPFTNYKLYKGNICNAELVATIFSMEQPTVLIHLAAETHVDNSFGNSMQFTQTNIFGTHTLLECAKAYGKLKLFLHMSTDEVYGSVNSGECLSEGANFAPSNPYAATKVGAEMLCYSYRHSFKLPIVITRCNNIISPYQDVEKLVPRCISSIKYGALIPIHGDGQSLRTFIDARDVASALETVIQYGAEGNVWIYNIGTTSKNEYTVLQVVKEVLKILKPNEYNINNFIEFVPDRAFQDHRYSIDSSILRNLGWSEQYSFQDSLKYILQ